MITHVPVAAVLVLNTPDDGRLRPKHVEWLCRNKTCTVLHQVGASFDLYYDARKHKIKTPQFMFTSHTYVPLHNICRIWNTCPSGLKEHTEFPGFHKTDHAQKNSVNEYTFVYSTLHSTTKVQRSSKRTFGNSARLISGSLFTNGLHGPCIDGQSVCHIFLSLIIWFPDCVRSKFTHLTTSSREWLWQRTRSLSPFTRIENKHSIG